MSLLPAEVTAELGQLLEALQSPDNAVRSQAEDHLQNNWTVTRPEVLLMGLVELIGAQANTTTVSGLDRWQCVVPHAIPGVVQHRCNSF